MGNVAFTCDQVVAFVIAYKWAIISILVVLVILSWVCFGKKWNNVLKVFCAWSFSIVMWDVVSACEQVVTFFVAYKWAIISVLVGAIISCWVLFGKKWSNVLKVFCAGIFSIVIFDILFNWFEFYSKDSIETLSVGFWNFIILIVSAPVAFAIWHFRDENNRQQIENQRKDINLKEFQKLSEWVSGAHLPEIKTVSKTTNKCNLKSDAEIARQSTLPIEYTTEETEEYSKQPNTSHFDTFSKREGAVVLQISAIYNLLPFFRGDYGESFRRPAFNLLKSAWQAMQQGSLKKLEKKNLSDEALNRIFNELEQKANSPMGVALTQVLLSLNQENKELNLRNFPEMLPNICLAGMNFQLNGVSKTESGLSSLDLFGADFRGAVLIEVPLLKAILVKADLRGATLVEAELQDADLSEANLQAANLQEAKLRAAKLQATNLQEANLQAANLQEANLQAANLKAANLQEANLQAAKLEETNLQEANLQKANLQEANLQEANLQEANLQEANLQEANLLVADLQAADLQAAKLQRVDLQAANLQAAKLQRADLQAADLQAADLQAAKLQRADLQAADLRAAKLQRADLQAADLQAAKLQRADLQAADLRAVKLQAAKLQKANLQKANLQKANLQEANLQEANLQEANLREADLRKVGLLLAKLQNAYFNWLQLKNSKALILDTRITVNDFIKNIYPNWKKENDPDWEALTNEEQTKAMQQFCDQTKMLIFDDVENQIMPPL